MAAPEQEIAACRASHHRLCSAVDELRPEQVAHPSRLPGWTVGHVLTHLARNADSVVRRLEGARTGSLVPQYAGGDEGRAEEIEEGAARTPGEIRADVMTTSASVDRAFADFPSDAWYSPILLGSGEQRPASHLAVARWREVEIHHVDLGLGYTNGDWDKAFIDRFLPGVLASVAARAEGAALLAWAIGRGTAPELRSWG